MVSAWRGSRTIVTAATSRKLTASTISSATPGSILPDHGESDIGARRERQQQRRHLGQPELADEALAAMPPGSRRPARPAR